jgi:hypothetical protein
MPWEREEKRDELCHLCRYESEGDVGVSEVKTDRDKGHNGTSETTGIDPSLCFFLLSYTYFSFP